MMALTLTIRSSDLAAVAVARMAWRDGPVEDFHASADSQLDDAQMMRGGSASRGSRPFPVTTGWRC